MKFTNNEEFENYREEHGLSINEDFDVDIEWEEARIINPENDQKVVYALIPADEVAYERAKMELTITTRYHDWHNTIADAIHDQVNGYINDDSEDEDGNPIVLDLFTQDIVEYNRQVKAYNQYGDAECINTDMTALKILDIVEKNTNQI